ncbi:hypothetical protein Nepgr_013798 [Nepenthes gracilis]|uniref:Uncharacterized protein n=1 Tax=Nepenthes gracilis TaxID=150966 RepID=A0AAD3SJW4_NEPGR|nr:hypothetical protein Nepgr_013798 [Nepenthes gracilis]
MLLTAINWPVDVKPTAVVVLRYCNLVVERRLKGVAFRLGPTTFEATVMASSRAFSHEHPADASGLRRVLVWRRRPFERRNLGVTCTFSGSSFISPIC